MNQYPNKDLKLYPGLAGYPYALIMCVYVLP